MSHSSFQRIRSIDYLRGLTICFMIIVSMPGNYDTTFPALKHALWHGFTPTDLVFPSFIFVSGNAIFIAAKKHHNNDLDHLWLTLKRAMIIFLFGVALYWFPFFKVIDGTIQLSPISQIRILGVLQRIAICYFLTAILVRHLNSSRLIWLSGILLISYWILLYLLPHGKDPLSIHDNAVRYLDLKLLGENHLYQGEGFPFDPEGLLSTIPALVNCLAGFLSMKFLADRQYSFESLLQLCLAACLLFFIAYMWNYLLPINKKLWTGSFSLLTISLDFFILSALVYLLEIKKYDLGSSFFTVFGKNPLTIYLLFEMLGTILYLIPVNDNHAYGWIYITIFSYAGGYAGSFLFAVSFMLLCWLVAKFLDKQKWYLHV